MQDNEDNQNGIIANVSSNERSSLDTIRDIYEEITGKNQELSKVFKEKHIVTFDDFKQVITKLQQAISEQKCISATCSFNIVYLNDVQVQLNSFKEFSEHETSQASAVESISIEFNYLYSKGADGKPVSSKISIVLISAIALREKAAISHGVKPEKLRLDSNIAGWVRIEHSNYIIGKFLLSTVTDWYEGLNKIDSNITESVFSAVKGWIPTSFKILYQLIFVLFIYSFSGKIFFEDMLHSEIAESVLIILFGFFALSNISWRIGLMLERHITSISSASVIVLSKADERMLVRFRASNLKSTIKAIVVTLANLFISGLASWVVVQITT